MNNQLKYRPEIDGLRALAVISVILFHARFELFSGGFVGVDVFFVISGYLITTILIEDMENKRFNIVNFYERRARRILPALFFVMLVSIPFALIWMLPSQLKEFSQSIMAVSLFASNILFWRKSGYFETAAEDKPFLHTWSLAVEEQYYLLFPIFLIITWRFGKNRVFWLIVVISAISLMLSEWGWRNKTTANFYLAPTRAWELFAGSITAFIAQKNGVQKNSFLALLGLIAIIFSIFIYDKSTPFPSVYTLVPVLGVVLLALYADKKTLAAKILSMKLFVGIGLISYSAYLWHQPLFVFAKVASASTITERDYLALSLLSLILGYLTWKFIERPFRNQTLSSKKIFNSSFLGIISFLIIGTVINLNEGFTNRFSEKELSFVVPKNGDTSGCHNFLEANDILNGKRCIVSVDNDFIIDIAVIGDSHASSITDAFKFGLTNLGRGFYAYNGSWCVPLINFATNTPNKNGCLDEINLAYSHILLDKKIKTVVLHAQWANYEAGYRWNDTNIASYIFSEDGNFDYSNAVIENNLKEFSRAVEYTFKKLYEANKEVILILSIPEFETHVPKALNPKIPFISQKEKLLQLPITNYQKRNSSVTKVLVKNSIKYGFSILNPSLLLCDLENCFSHNNKGSFYFDESHLSFLGASQIVPSLVDLISEIENN